MHGYGRRDCTINNARFRSSTTHLLCLLLVGLVAATAGVQPLNGPRSPVRAAEAVLITNHHAPAGWLERVNGYRTGSGLEPVIEQPQWSAGILAHLRYLALTDPSLRVGEYANAHLENPASPYYTPEGDAAGRSSNLGGSSTAAGAIDGWISGPFHAIGILRRHLREVAFARDEALGGTAGLDVIRGLQYSDPPTDAVLFPGSGASVPQVYLGGEVPNPVEGCPGEWWRFFGFPMILMLPSDPVAGAAAELIGPDGRRHRTNDETLCLVDEHTFETSDPVYGPTGRGILMGDNAVFLVADRELSPGWWQASYHSEDSAASVSWCFQISPGVSPSAGSVPSFEPFERPGGPVGSGYRMLDSRGRVYAFGSASHLGDLTTRGYCRGAVAMDSTTSGDGYVIALADGAVESFGDAPQLGGAALMLDPGESVSSISLTPSGKGYWLFTDVGRAVAFGDAVHHGDLASLNILPVGGIVASQATTSGLGYHMIGSDGGIFAFGDAEFHGSIPQVLPAGTLLDEPIVGLAPTRSGAGYWLVASDGGLFAFGDAPFLGSIPGLGIRSLNAPIRAVVGADSGYLMVASDGGAFNFGGPFHGSLGNEPPPVPVVAINAFR